MGNPRFTREQNEWLKRNFPRMTITPDSTMSEIQYNAGQQQVLDLIDRNTEGYRRQQVGRDPI